MRVMLLPTEEQCMTCAHCPEADAAPGEACIKCMRNPENIGEVIQFVMNEGTAYAVVLVDNEFWLADINNIRLIKE